MKKIKNTNYHIYNDGTIKKNELELIPTVTDSGFFYVRLFIDGKYKKFNVHYLVAEYYLNFDKEKEFLIHIDGDRSNNSAENLQITKEKVKMKMCCFCLRKFPITEMRKVKQHTGNKINLCKSC